MGEASREGAGVQTSGVLSGMRLEMSSKKPPCGTFGAPWAALSAPMLCCGDVPKEARGGRGLAGADVIPRGC